MSDIDVAYLFQQQPLLDDPDGLFAALIEQTCADCGAQFETSRRSTYCALCVSLRAGQVGPATVQCPGCGMEHQIPVLAPHKLCKCCVVDLEMTAGALRARLEQAEQALDEALTRLDADLAHANAGDHARYEAAVEARGSGLWRGEARPAAFFAQQWQTAIARNDGLSPLLRARLAYDAAGEAWETAQREVAIGLEECERAREATHA